MADKESEKTLEMRVAELEDKLKGLQITEEEMKAYNKVAALLGGGTAASSGMEAAGAVGLTPAPDSCVISQCINQCVRACTIVQQCIRPCVINQCIRACTIRACTIRQCCIQDCINECGGGGGGFLGGGGFGSLGG